jgi:hypothetical protein
MTLFNREAVQRITALADEIRVEPAVLLAVAEVESAGKPFMRDGVTPRFLFEAHKFWKHLGPGEKRDRAARDGLARRSWNKKVQYQSQRTEQGRMDTLARARAIDEEAANKSCSWGLGQVMGEHAVAMKYPSATEMVAMMRGNVAAQVEVMARFIRLSPKMLADMRAKRWAAFAKAYNGPGYKENAYDTKMAEAYERWSRQAGASPVRAVTAAPPADEPVAITDVNTVRRVQTQLRDLGYVEVGTPDGKIGRYTKGAIAAYRVAKGLPPGDFIDDALILALAKDDQPAEVSQERANADAAKVQAVAAEARPTWCAKIWSGVAGFIAFLGTILQGVLSQFEAAKGYLAPVQDMLSDVPPWAWCAIAAGIAFYIWKASATAEAAITEAVQTGARR